MDPKFPSAIATYGAEAKAKLTNRAATGDPEDQLRAPLERLVADLAELCGFRRAEVTAVGETSLSELKTRPDYAITVRNALIGFIEVKAPGKGADPRRFRDRHDKQQLQSLPNLAYTDGNEFSLWRSGQMEGSLVRLTGDIQTAGDELTAPPALLSLFENFIRWQPIPPRDAKQLAEVSARLCQLLRDEVTEQLSLGSPALTALAADRARRRLAAPTLPRSDRRAVRRRVCASRHVRPADGPRARHPAGHRPRPGRSQVYDCPRRQLAACDARPGGEP